MPYVLTPLHNFIGKYVHFKTAGAFLYLLTVFAPITIDDAIKNRANASEVPSADLYLGQKPPSLTPILLAPGLISTPEHRELNAVFSPDGKELYFSRAIDDVYRLFVIKKDVSGKWTTPTRVRLKERDQWEIVDPWITPDGRRMHYISNAPTDVFAENSVNIWEMDREADGWGAPRLLPRPINSDAVEIYPLVVNSGNMYFTSSREGGLGDRDLYVVANANNDRVEPINIGAPVNTAGREGDVFVAPDESYMIITADREGGYGGADLYISHRRPDGTWQEPRNLGPLINSSDHDYTPVISPDGKYFFFTRQGDVYWVSSELVFASSSPD